jgi:hypothetical protein
VQLDALQVRQDEDEDHQVSVVTTVAGLVTRQLLHDAAKQPGLREGLSAA